MTVGHIVKIDTKSFQGENKKAGFGDTKDTILGPGYFKGEVCSKEAPFKT